MDFSEIEELLEICKRAGVAKIEIEGKIKLELFPFSYTPVQNVGQMMENLTESVNMTDEELLLMSAN
jgi:hypothetical protein